MDLRPVDLAALLDRSVELYRGNFLLLAGIGAVMYVPFGLLGLLGALLGETVHAVLTLVGSLALLPVWPLALGALVHASAQRYLDQPATLGSSYGATFQRAMPVILTAYLVGALVTAGLFALVVGAAVVSVATTFALHAVMLEDQYYDRALVRSWNLVKEQWPRVLAMGVALWILQMVLGMIPVVLLAFLVRDANMLNALTAAWSALSNSVLIPVGVIPFVLLYYDVRIRKEGLDLRLMADALGPPPAPLLAPPAWAPPAGAHCPHCQWPFAQEATFCVGCGAPARAPVAPSAPGERAQPQQAGRVPAVREEATSEEASRPATAEPTSEEARPKAPRPRLPVDYEASPSWRSHPPCPDCGAPAPLGASFCPSCGARRT